MFYNVEKKVLGWKHGKESAWFFKGGLVKQVYFPNDNYENCPKNSFNDISFSLGQKSFEYQWNLYLTSFAGATGAEYI